MATNSGQTMCERALKDSIILTYFILMGFEHGPGVLDQKYSLYSTGYGALYWTCFLSLKHDYERARALPSYCLLPPLIICARVFHPSISALGYDSGPKHEKL